jgi:L-methionine (R)-S-oxide reductase
MFEARPIGNVPKPELYREIAQQLEALLEGERDPVANAANTAALVFQTLPDLNWAGFYFLRDGNQLVLGPFQGRPACVRIPVGQGVVGTAAARRESIIVADVELFPGHIACDTASRSELVVPLTAGERLIGVLDLDSPLPSRFDAEDRAGVESLATIYMATSDADQVFNAMRAT